MPYAMRVAGGLLGGVAVILAGAVCAVAGVLLGWCLELAADDFDAAGIKSDSLGTIDIVPQTFGLVTSFRLLCTKFGPVPAQKAAILCREHRQQAESI